MVVEKGYKQTEVGVIPEDWEVKEFVEVMDGFSSGQTPYRAVPEFYKGDIPWITSGELNYNVITDTIEKITIEGAREANLKTIPKGTFLFAITGLEAAGTRGSCAITGIEATTNQSCMALYPKKGLLITPYLYHYYVRYGNELAFKYCQGTKQQSYTGGIAKKLPIIVPPTIEEQTAIANALSDMDALIAQTEKLIEKKKAIKQGVMQELLKPKEGWVTKKLGEVCEIKKGQLITDSTRVNGDIPVIAGGKTPAYYHNKANRKGNIITISGSGANAGYVSFYDHPIFASDCSTISNSDKYNVEFIFYWFQLNQSLIYSLQTGGAQPHIHPSDLNPLEIFIPSIEIQNQIATIFRELQKELNKLETKIQKLKNQKQGMMQALLTGKIRLI